MEIFAILDHFLHFYPPNDPENQNFEKLKKKTGDIIILHMCTINGNHMMFHSWDMEPDRQNFLSFWTIFCSYPTSNPKNQYFEKMKKNIWRYYHVTQLYHKWQSYAVWFLRYGAWQTEFFVILDLFLPFYPPNNLKNQTSEKMKKNTWTYHNFTQVPQKSWL